MSEEKKPDNADGGGNEPGTGARTFTQEEVNALVGQKALAVKKQYADYDEMKAKAAKLAEIEEQNKTELQKAQEAAEQADKKAQAALQTANEKLIKAEFISKASVLGVKHPNDAYNLADRSDVAIDENGDVSGVEKAVKSLIENGRLVMSKAPKAPNLDGGAGNQYRPGEDGETKLDADEKAVAKMFGISAEEYEKNK